MIVRRSGGLRLRIGAPGSSGLVPAIRPGGRSQLRLFALLAQRISAISDDIGIIRIELEHLIEIFDRQNLCASTDVSEATIIESVGIVRVKLDGGVEIVHSAISLADLVVRIASVVERNGLTSKRCRDW